MAVGVSLSFVDSDDIKISFIIDKELKDSDDEFLIKIEGDKDIISLDREDWIKIAKFINEYF